MSSAPCKLNNRLVLGDLVFIVNRDRVGEDVVTVALTAGYRSPVPGAARCQPDPVRSYVSTEPSALVSMSSVVPSSLCSTVTWYWAVVSADTQEILGRVPGALMDEVDRVAESHGDGRIAAAYVIPGDPDVELLLMGTVEAVQSFQDDGVNVPLRTYRW